jgi:hypothetical protein
MMSEQLHKYRVQVYIRGSIGRPPYDGHIDVYAENDELAAERAVRDLRRGVWQDVHPDSFQVQSVTRKF